MRLSIAHLIAAVLAIQTSAIAADAPELTGDLKAMQGEWVVDHAESPTGEILKAYAGTMRHTIRGSKACNPEKPQSVETSFILDETQTPKRQLWTRHTGQVTRAVYKIEGDTLTTIVLLAPDQATQDWPTEFKPGWFDLVLVYKRL
jgi:uncharacterized protein (TIGR03067 family)